MKIEIHKNNNTAMISFDGSLYVEDAASVREQLVALAEEGVSMLTLDFSGLDYIDSAGLGVLISVNKRCLQKGGGVTITGLKGMVGELFRLTRLDLVFKVQE